MGRRLGQHFLVDPALLDRIVAAVRPEQGAPVLEIGAGTGTLTARLAQAGARVVAIERDPRLAAELAEKHREWTMVRIVAGDALELDWHALLELAPEPPPAVPRAPFKIAGNIPYAITSPLIEKALRPPLPERIVFTVQREVADRLAARPATKAYGALSVGVQAIASVERLFNIAAGSFRPPPRVESAVVRLTPLAEPLIEPDEHEAFRRFVAGLFSRRRKQIGRALRHMTQRGASEVEALLGSVQLRPEERAEALSPAVLVDLFRRVRKTLAD